MLCLSLTLLSFDNKDDDENAFLQEVATESNKLCPSQLTENLRIDKVEVRANKTLEYFFTITGEIKDQDTNIERAQKYMTNMFRNNNSPEMQILKEMNVTLTLTFYDTEGNTCFTIKISPEDYNNTKEISR